MTVELDGRLVLGETAGDLVKMAGPTATFDVSGVSGTMFYLVAYGFTTIAALFDGLNPLTPVE